jgi:hypothetical protein
MNWNARWNSEKCVCVFTDSLCCHYTCELIAVVLRDGRSYNSASSRKSHTQFGVFYCRNLLRKLLSAFFNHCVVVHKAGNSHQIFGSILQDSTTVRLAIYRTAKTSRRETIDVCERPDCYCNLVQYSTSVLERSEVFRAVWLKIQVFGNSTLFRKVNIYRQSEVWYRLPFRVKQSDIGLPWS